METSSLQPLFFDPMRFPTPEARYEEALRLAETATTMAVIVWVDDAQRSRKLQQSANEQAGLYFECERYRTAKRFRFALAEKLGLSSHGAQWELDQRIEDYLTDCPSPLFLDHADRLTERQLRGLRHFYDVAEARIVIAGATRRLLDLADDTDKGGQFFSRCIHCHVDASTGSSSDSSKARDGDEVAGQISQNNGAIAPVLLWLSHATTR